MQKYLRRGATMEGRREFPPSFQDGFGFEMLNPPQCGGLFPVVPVGTRLRGRARLKRGINVSEPPLAC